MEEKSFGWLLFELSIAKAPVRILEVGLCRGTKLLAWYYNDSMGVVCKKTVKPNFKSKMILSQILNERVPVLEKYSPDKVICYLYHLNGMRIVKVKEASELAENQLHGLQVRSIHQALVNSSDFYSIYKLNGLCENGEILNELFCQTYKKEAIEVKDSLIYERALNLTMVLSDFLYRRTGKYFKEIQMDLVADSAGLLYILKVHKIILSPEVPKIDYFSRRTGRLMTKVVEFSSDESIEEGANQINLYKNFLEGRKKDLGKVMRKQVPQNSGVFLDMIAKTFDRERKVMEHCEILKERRKELEGSGNVSPGVSNAMSQSSERLKTKQKRGFGNIGELLGYLENTRPKIWVRDREHCDGSPVMVSPLSDRIYRENTGIDKRQTSLKSSFYNSPSSNRGKFESDFASYLKEEQNRLKNKIITKQNIQKIRNIVGKNTKGEL